MLYELRESYVEFSGCLCGKLTAVGLAGQACGLCICPSVLWKMLAGFAWSVTKLSPEAYEGETLHPIF